MRLLSSVDDCFKEGLLKNVPKNKVFAERSLSIAKHFFEESFDLIQTEMLDMSLIALYNSCFHAARALLFRDGVKEHSHYCVSKYIEEKYSSNELITLKHAIVLDSLREKRNDIQYSIERPELDKESIGEIYNEVEDFIEKVEKELKK